VTIGNVSSVQFDYDIAASLAVTLTGDATHPVPDGVSVTVGNPQLVPNGTKNYTGTGASRTISGLFPFLDGYQVWAGACADADPEGQIVELDAGGNPVVVGPFWPGATRAPVVAVEGGATTPVSVALGRLDVVVLDAIGAPVAGATVRVVHGPDSACTGESLVIGATDATGSVRTALPFGTWSVQVEGRTPLTAWPDAVVDPRVAGAVPATVVVQ